ncbi:MAG: thioredoxin [Proteiniphilum sp.]|nr:thioredoxin [Proteiniphilum sp.]
MNIKLLLASALTVLLTVSCTSTNGTKQSTSNDGDATEQNLKTNNNNMAKTINLTREQFLAKVANIEANPQEWNYLGDKPAIIDFYADWCGPCKVVAPILEELAGEYADDIYIYKVDTEAEQQLSAEFGIRSIPSLLFVPMEGQPQMAQGALPKDALKEAINEVLLKN